MFSTIVIGLSLLAALLFFVIRPKGVVDGADVNFTWVGLLPLGVAILFAAFSCTAIVQAKQVGVVTTFGKPADSTLSSGFHVKAPWQKVTQIDATIQTDEYRGDHCITVRLGDGNTACISATIRWSVSEENANTVYADFRSDNPTESLRDAVVSTQFKAAMNTTFAGYDPINEVEGKINASFNPDYEDMNNKVTSLMLSQTDELVEIDSITISYLKLGDKTQAKIDSYLDEVARTRVAKQAQSTAKEQAEANKILSDSISNDPNVLVARCFDLLGDGAFVPPAGFSCWNVGGSSVVIPGGGK